MPGRILGSTAALAIMLVPASLLASADSYVARETGGEEQS